MTSSIGFDEIYDQIADAFVGNTKAHSERETSLVLINQVSDDALKKAEAQCASVQKSAKDSLTQAQSTASTKADHELTYAGLTPANLSPVSRPPATTVVDPGGQFNRAVERVNGIYQTLWRARTDLEEVRRQVAAQKQRFRRSLFLGTLVAVVVFTGVYIARALTPFNLVRMYSTNGSGVGYFNRIDDVAFSPDGKYVVATTDLGQVIIWLTETGGFAQHISYQKGYGPNASSQVVFSPDEKYIIAGDDDHKVRLWEFETGNLVRTITDPATGVYSVAFSPDGKYVLGRSREKGRQEVE